MYQQPAQEEHGFADWVRMGGNFGIGRHGNRTFGQSWID